MFQEYDFEVKYKSGDQNTFEDALSRLPTNDTFNCLESYESLLKFDEDISDIFRLEEIHIDDILSKYRIIRR